MTIDEMITLFDIIQDKYNSAYYTNSEKVKFLNLAQNLFINESVFGINADEKRLGEVPFVASSIEPTTINTSLVEPLIISDINLTADANGDVLFSDIETGINAETSSNEKLMYILAVYEDQDGEDIYIRFVRHNDLYKHNQNEFKKPTVTEKVYRVSKGKITIYPKGTHSVYLNVLKSPVDMVYVAVSDPGNVSCELPYFTHNEVLAIALEISGIATRDQALLDVRQLKNEA